MSRLLVLFSVLSVSLGKEWALNTKTQAAIVCGVGAGSDDYASAAAGDNGTGAFVERLAGNGVWTNTHLQAGMILDSAVTPSGVTVASSIWGVFLSADGKTYTTAEGVSGASQSANVWGPNKEYFGLVGNFVVSNPDSSVPTSVSGVAYSKDSGATWSVSSTIPAAAARYGSFPSENTWYVASGMWGNDPSLKEGAHALTSRLSVHKKTGSVFNGEKLSGRNSTHVKAGETGWFGAVSKTTDGGKTWSQVFQTDLANDYIYFNGISCSSEANCVVVGEGEDATGAYLTQAYVTFDAGATWDVTLKTGDVGLMQAKFLSDSEGWLAGTSKDGRNLYGQFYHTLDGGKTWNLEQSLNNCFCIDMDFGATKGFAACSSSSGSSCAVAEYY